MTRLITVAGPPSSGKTSIILKTAELLAAQGRKLGVIKFDCTITYDDRAYEQLGIPVKVGLSGTLCPDHFFINNIEECLQWGQQHGLDILVTESAGLCNRCAPHLRDTQSVCVIDNLSGINTPKKVGPMLKLADVVVITKSDIVSQAEREIFAFRVKQASPSATVLNINGITGQGANDLASLMTEAPELESLEERRLRTSMPAATCSYCLGETRIGKDHQRGYTKKINW